MRRAKGNDNPVRPGSKRVSSVSRAPEHGASAAQPPARAAVPSKRFLFRCQRGCRRIVRYVSNSVLFITLLLLSAVLYAEWRDRPIRLPEPLLHWIIDLAAPEEFAIVWDRVVPDAKGTLRFHAVEVRHRATGEPLFTARTLRARPNWLRLATGMGIPLDGVESGDGRLFLPGMWSAPGVPDIIVDELAGSIVFRHRTVEIRDLRGTFGAARFRLRGSVQTGTDAKRPALRREDLREIARGISRWHGIAHSWGPVWLEATVSPDTEDAHQVRFHAVADELAYPKWGEIDSLRVNGRLTLAPGKEPSGRIEIAARSLGHGQVTVEGLRATLERSGPEATPVLDATASRAWYDALRASDFSARIALPNMRRAAVRRARAVFAGMDMRLHGIVCPENPTESRITFQTRIDPATTLGILFPGNTDLERFPVSANTRSWIRADLSWTDDEWVEPTARIDGELWDFSVADETYHHTLFEGRATRSGLTLSPVAVNDTDGQHATGSFRVDFDNSTFRVLASGSLFPDRLDNYFQGDWWANLRERIKAGKRPFHGDVDAVHNWKHRGRTRSVIRVKGEDFTYSGHPVARGDAFIRQGPAWVDLARLSAETHDGGVFKGFLGWRLHGGAPPEYEKQDLLVDIESTLALPALTAAFDQPWIASMFAAEIPPRVAIRGKQTSARGDRVIDSDLLLEVDADAFSHRNIAADQLRLNARLRNERLDLDIRRLDAFNGRAEGTVSIADRMSPEPPFAIDLRGDNLSYPSVMTLFRQFTMTEDERAEAPPMPERGVVRFTLAGEGEFPHVERFTGEGAIALDEADLGTIRLVGVLSRILEQVGLPLASFSLHSLETNFRVADSVLHLPNLTFQGPTMRVRAEGDIALPDQRLALDLRVFPLTPEENPLVSALGLVFRPLTYALRIDLSGTPEKPSWRFRHNPLNVFRASPKPIAPLNGEQVPPPADPDNGQRNGESPGNP